MTVVQRTRIESPLPDMTAGRLSCVPVGRISSVRLLQSPRHRVPCVRYGDEMHMIGHQAVAQHTKSMHFRILSEQRKIGDTVAVAGNNKLPGVATLRNMMRNIDDDNPSEPAHVSNVSDGVGMTADGGAFEPGV